MSPENIYSDHEYYVTVFTYKRKLQLSECLQSVVDSVKSQKNDVAILIVDNDTLCSAEEVFHQFKFKERGISFYYLPEPNKGIVQARNSALKYFRTLHEMPKGVLWIDDDETANVEWVKELCGSLRYADLVNGFCNLFWDSPSELDAISHLIRCKNDKYEGETNAPLHTANLAISENILKSNILFDNWFNNKGGEDSDFSFRCQKEGFRLWYNPNAIVNEKQEGNRTTITYRCERAKMANYVWQEIKKRHVKNYPSLFMLVAYLARYLFYKTLSIFFKKNSSIKIKSEASLGAVLYYMNTSHSTKDY